MAAQIIDLAAHRAATTQLPTAPGGVKAEVIRLAARRIREELTRPQEVLGELHLCFGDYVPPAVVELRKYSHKTTPAHLAELTMELACVVERMATVMPTAMAPIQDALADALVLIEAERDDLGNEAA